MSTPTQETTEQLDLTEFEFDIPCDCGRRHRRTRQYLPCPDLAAWAVTSNRHCRDGVHHGLMCEQHHDELLSGLEFRCGRCHDVYVPLDLVVRTERIR